MPQWGQLELTFSPVGRLAECCCTSWARRPNTPVTRTSSVRPSTGQSPWADIRVGPNAKRCGPIGRPCGCSASDAARGDPTEMLVRGVHIRRSGTKEIGSDATSIAACNPGEVPPWLCGRRHREHRVARRVTCRCRSRGGRGRLTGNRWVLEEASIIAGGVRVARNEREARHARRHRVQLRPAGWIRDVVKFSHILRIPRCR